MYKAGRFKNHNLKDINLNVKNHSAMKWQENKEHTSASYKGNLYTIMAE